MASSFEERNSVIDSPEDKIKLFDLVCEGASKQQWADWLRLPLEHAVFAGEVGLVKTLIRAGANIESDWESRHGHILLHSAAEGGKHEIVLALLKAGAKSGVNKRHGPKKWTALHYAAYGGHETIVHALMFAGADLSCTDVYGETPLHIAAREGHRQVVFDLALGKADLNKLSCRHWSPLNLTAVYGHASTTEALLTAGADADLRCGVRERRALAEAAFHGHVNVMRALIRHGVNVNAGNPTEQGATALHVAAYFNRARAVDVLVVEGDADVEVRLTTRSAATPLFCAAQRNSCDALRALLQHKAAVEVETNSDGCRPLAAACINMAEEAVEVLLRWGAEEKCPNNCGRSASDVIGEALPSSKKRERKDDIERLRRLLARAPMDRAWRRRGILVLCRAFPDKLCLGVKSKRVIGGGEQPASLGSRAAKFSRSVKVEVQKEAPGNSTVAMGTSSENIGEEAGHDVRDSVEMKVMELEHEDLFRRVVLFL